METQTSSLILYYISQVSKFPEDYDLWYLGVYDDLTGKFSAEASPQHVVKAVTVKQSVQ